MRASFTSMGDRARIGWFEKRKRFDAAQPQREHAQDHPGERSAPDLRVGIGRARGEISFGIQPVADARRDAAAAPLALVGAGLTDRLDVQAVEFLPRAVALDPGQARVHHVVDPRHGERGLGHVGGQHDPSLRAWVEDAVLVACGQARVQRQHFGVPVFALLQGPVRVADLALAGEEDQGVAHGAVPRNLVAGGDDRVEHAAFASLPLA